jgi:hypothetical protein
VVARVGIYAYGGIHDVMILGSCLGSILVACIADWRLLLILLSYICHDTMLCLLHAEADGFGD